MQQQTGVGAGLPLTLNQVVLSEIKMPTPKANKLQEILAEQLDMVSNAPRLSAICDLLPVFTQVAEHRAHYTLIDRPSPEIYRDKNWLIEHGDQAGEFRAIRIENGNGVGIIDWFTVEDWKAAVFRVQQEND